MDRPQNDKKWKREPVGIEYILEFFHIPDLNHEGRRVSNMILLINFNCYYSNILLWDFKISNSWKYDREKYIPLIKYLNLKIQPIPRGPSLSLHPLQLPNKACSQTRWIKIKLACLKIHYPENA